MPRLPNFDLKFCTLSVSPPGFKSDKKMLRDDEKKAAKIDITNLQTCLLQKKKKHREIEIQHLSTWVATCLKMLYLDLSVLFFCQPLIASTCPTGAKVSEHDETRTRNLLIRSQTPYPLGHAVMAIQILKIKLKRPIGRMIMSLPAFVSIFPQIVDGKNEHKAHRQQNCLANLTKIHYLRNVQNIQF